jgi:hypothetical protein
MPYTYWPIYILQMILEIWTFWNSKNFMYQFLFIMNAFQIWMVSYHHFNFFPMLKFKKILLRKISLLNWISDFEFFNTHIYHLTQISLINMTLKWRYINICDKIDNFSIIWHNFWLIWLWLHLFQNDFLGI